MGQDIEKTEFGSEDYRAFRHALNENLGTFQNLLKQPGFGEGKQSFGSELELYLLDQQGYPKPVNDLVLDAAQDEQLTLELNRFNLEYNYAPLIDEARPFSKMVRQMNSSLKNLDKITSMFDARILPIGILPTLRASDMGMHAITDQPRYHVLAKALREKRGEQFRIRIDGHDTLEMLWGDVTPEGANTSFQFHYRVSPKEFAASYNIAQLVTPLVLGLSANSPIFLGMRLWQETRIALFKQSIDYRLDDGLEQHLPARVMFGLGWVRKDIYELMAEAVYLFEPLLPITSGIDSSAQFAMGQAPELAELRLHQGSIWNWNRPIYDPADNGHLRIEARALPAGPSTMNMAASAALLSGLMKGLHGQIDELMAGLPFRYAEQNFYRAAKHGLQAQLFWPNIKSGSLEERSLVDILRQLIPYAEEGLDKLGIESSEARAQLAITEAMLESGINGAQWQMQMFDKLCQRTTNELALEQLVARYYDQYRQGKPVHEWSFRI